MKTFFFKDSFEFEKLKWLTLYEAAAVVTNAIDVQPSDRLSLVFEFVFH